MQMLKMQVGYRHSTDFNGSQAQISLPRFSQCNHVYVKTLNTSEKPVLYAFGNHL